MTCDFSKYSSQTIYWDDKSFKVYHPETISYSISTETPIIGKKIAWDTSSQHILSNPSNYSYSIDYNFNECANYQLWVNGTRLYPGNNPANPLRKPTRYRWEHRRITTAFGQFLYANYFWIEYHGNNNCSGFLNATDWRIDGFFGNPNPRTYPFYFLKNDGSPVPRKIIINDGGIISEYSITNTNSVQVVDILGSSQKKITINGNKFDLIDENSIEILCTDPIPQCPPGTIECDCGDVTWCLEPTDYGYLVVSCLNN